MSKKVSILLIIIFSATFALAFTGQQPAGHWKAPKSFKGEIKPWQPPKTVPTPPKTWSPPKTFKGNVKPWNPPKDFPKPKQWEPPKEFTQPVPKDQVPKEDILQPPTQQIAPTDDIKTDKPNEDDKTKPSEPKDSKLPKHRRTFPKRLEQPDMPPEPAESLYPKPIQPTYPVPTYPDYLYPEKDYTYPDKTY